MDPENPFKLAGAPDYDSTEITLTLHTNLPTVSSDTLALTLPIPVRNGAPMCITLKANVVMPELELKQDVLGFGEVQAGRCRVICVDFVNHRWVVVWCDCVAMAFNRLTSDYQRVLD